MRSAAAHHLHTLDDYFAHERVSPARHEYVDGQIFVMAGGSLRHDVLETRILQLLGRALAGGPCQAMTSNRRIATADGLYTYADGSVFCGPIAMGPGQSATNPTVLIEVLSASTREYDEGEKLERYRSIPSLRQILHVEQEDRRVVSWTRSAEGWVRSEVTSGSVPLEALGVEVALDELYDGTEQYPAG
jgi:Uma2 family endonuclease